MRTNSEKSADEAVDIVEVDGHKLTVVARRSFEDEWELSIFNELGVATNWLDVFSTADEALNAGAAAIDEEGAQVFVNVEGFDYLKDLPLRPLGNH